MQDGGFTQAGSVFRAQNPFARQAAGIKTARPGAWDAFRFWRLGFGPPVGSAVSISFLGGGWA